MKADGFSLLIRAMQAENDKLITKSAFMLRHMLVTNPSHKGIQWSDSDFHSVISSNIMLLGYSQSCNPHLPEN